MNNLSNYRTDKIPSWCPGCGNYLILSSLIHIFAEKKIPSHNIVIAYDIGCAGNMADLIKTYAIHALHGRIIPVLTGIYYQNPNLTLIGIGGDGGVYGEGLNHLIAAARANLNLKIFVSNNYLYSLTTGQASPTTPKGAKTKSTPEGVDLEPIEAIKIVKAASSQVFAQKTTVKKPKELIEKIREAIVFKGFSLLDIEQECVTFGKLLRPSSSS